MKSPIKLLKAAIPMTLLIGCQTTTQLKNEPTQKETPPSPEKLSSAESEDRLELFKVIQEIERAFLSGRCSDVLRIDRSYHNKLLWPTLFQNGLAPTLTDLAVKVCRAKTMPTSPQARSQALAALADAQKKLSPLIPADAFLSLAASIDSPHLQFWTPPRTGGGAPSAQIDVPPTERAQFPAESLNDEEQRVYSQARLSSEKREFAESLALYTVLLEMLKGRKVETELLQGIARERGYVLGQVEDEYTQFEHDLRALEMAGNDAAAQELAERQLGKFPGDTFRNRILEHIARLQKNTLFLGESSPSTSRSFPSQGGQTQSPEEIVEEAKRALNRNQTDRALEILDRIPEQLRTDQIARLRRDVVEQDISQLRFQVTQIFQQAQHSGNAAERLERIHECIRILQHIQTKHPSASPATLAGVERNLKALQLEAQDLAQRLNQRPNE